MNWEEVGEDRGGAWGWRQRGRDRGKWRNHSRAVWIFQSMFKTKETLRYVRRSYSALVESQEVWKVDENTPFKRSELSVTYLCYYHNIRIVSNRERTVEEEGKHHWLQKANLPYPWLDQLAGNKQKGEETLPYRVVISIGAEYLARVCAWDLSLILMMIKQ